MSSPKTDTPTTLAPPSQPPTFLRPLHLTLLLATPLLIALPPRKLDLYTFALSGLFVYSASELYLSRPASSQRTAATGVMGALGHADVDLKGGNVVSLPGVDPQTSPRELLRREGEGKGGKEGEGGGVEAMAKKLWMGQEGRGWKERRIAEEKERLEQGEGYWDLILGQVREVMGRDRESGERKG